MQVLQMHAHVLKKEIEYTIHGHDFCDCLKALTLTSNNKSSIHASLPIPEGIEPVS